jgi:hypothetical protein
MLVTVWLSLLCGFDPPKTRRLRRGCMSAHPKIEQGSKIFAHNQNLRRWRVRSSAFVQDKLAKSALSNSDVKLDGFGNRIQRRARHARTPGKDLLANATKKTGVGTRELCLQRRKNPISVRLRRIRLGVHLVDVKRQLVQCERIITWNRRRTA